MRIFNIIIMSIFFSLLLFLSSCIKTSEPEIHLIPKDYKGPVIIIFEDTRGKPVKYEDGKRVFEIPSDGILRTQFKKQENGFVPRGKIKYFYSDGNIRNEIAYLLPNQDSIDNDGIYVFGEEISKNTVRYLVGELSEGDLYYNKLRKMLDKLLPTKIQ